MLLRIERCTVGGQVDLAGKEMVYLRAAQRQEPWIGLCLLAPSVVMAGIVFTGRGYLKDCADVEV
jgi:hypothetical protein